MFAVSRVDQNAPGELTVGLDYSDFATAFGGNYASRLRLVQYPACVLTTPERPGCRKAIPLVTDNDTQHHTLVTEVQASPGAGDSPPVTAPGTSPTTPSTNAPSAHPSASASPKASATVRGRALSGALISKRTTAVTVSGATVLATEAGGGGENGDYKVTSLSPSATWNVATNTGEFTWSYPMKVPPVPGGRQPTVGLNYSSGAVDGRTSGSGAQSGWVGEGFDLWSGYIERRYKSCEDDEAPKDDNGNYPGDQCWGYDNASITWNGHGGELIPDGNGKWHLKNDDGTRIERLTDANVDNGDNDNEYWKVTTTDGTSYYFGSNKGADGKKPATNATWTVPVFGDDKDEPCHGATFADSWCQQAWRWNLDYVVDPNGNAITYYYDTETNYYGRNLKAEDETPYIRGGVLNRIEYGLRSDNLTAAAPARVVFGSKERCLDSDVNCDPDKIADNQNLWPDVPWDLNCKKDTECKDFHGISSPTFWTRKRLDTVTTQILKADGTWRGVDSWALTYKWGTADYDRALLPISIQHTGLAATTPIPLPKTTLDYEERNNRVRAGDTGGLMKYRLDYVADEYGSEISVDYSTAQCTPTTLPSPESNTKRCFPVYWSYAGSIDPKLDWFNKYVINNVIVRDRTGRTPDMVTKYVYDEDGGAAWHFDDDDGLIKQKYKSWSQWRGYSKVSVLTGSDLVNDLASQTDHYYLRGMDGDRVSASDPKMTRGVLVDDGNGGTVRDDDAFTGQELRTVRLSKPGGSVVDWKQNIPRKFETASRTRPWGTTTANFVGTEYARTFTPTGPGAWRKSETRTDYDPGTGRQNWVSDLGGPGTNDDRCVRYTYADNITAWVRNLVAEKEVLSGSCDRTDVDRTKDVLSAARTYYDGSATAPKSDFKSVSRGRLTYSERLVSHAAADGSEPTYQKVSAVTGFDDFGRATKVEGADGNATTTVYTQTGPTGSPGLTNKVTVTKPPVKKDDGSSLQLTSSVTMDPAWAKPIVNNDESGGKTEVFYNALGQTTQVWLPDRSRAAGQKPSMEFTYQVAEGLPVVTGARKATNAGAMGPWTYQILDGLLRTRQVQAPGQNGGRIITDTMYDGRGQVSWVYNAFYNDQSGPAPALFGPDMQGLVHSQTRYSYDGVGRKTREALLPGAGDGTEVFATSYAYGSDSNGDWVTTTPPDGGTPTTAYADARGRNIETRQQSSASGGFITTHYSYDAADRVTKIVGPAGKTWENHYDQRGRLTSSSDPDKGTSTFTYDDFDHVISAADARGSAGKTFTDYDVLGRKLRVYAADSDGNKGDLVALWGYDTVRPGLLTFASRMAKGADGKTYEYKSRIDSYDAASRPKQTSLIIPDGAEGKGIDGTYSFTTAYNPDGTVQSAGLPAAGDLPAEVVTTTYDDFQRPVKLTGLSSYVTGTSYNNISQLSGYLLAAGGKQVDVAFDYDAATGRLTRSVASREGVDGYDRDATYAYNPVGTISRVTDVTGATSTGGVTTESQCFQYDYQQRLTNAWTQNTTSCAADPSTAEITGPDAYRKRFSYTEDGNRTKEETWAGGPNGGLWRWNRDYRYAGDTGVDNSFTGHQLAGYTQQVDGTNGGQTKTYGYTYDAAGNTTQRTEGASTLKYTWDSTGEISQSDDTATGKNTFVYDAEGNRLIRRDSTGTTLYTAGMEVHLANGTTTATRYYGHAGQTVAMRTSAGVTFLINDQHNTAELTIDANNLSKVSRRRYTPFGEERGTPAFPWPTTMDRGFVGGTKDNTGLTHLGAREYDPATGRFISPDPVFDGKDPQSWNNYAYADNSPITQSDGSGLVCRRVNGDYDCNNGDGVDRRPRPNNEAGHDVYDNNGNYLTGTQPSPPNNTVGWAGLIPIPPVVKPEVFKQQYWDVYQRRFDGRLTDAMPSAQPERDLAAAVDACQMIKSCSNSPWMFRFRQAWLMAIGPDLIAGGLGGESRAVKALAQRLGVRVGGSMLKRGILKAMLRGCGGNSFVAGTRVLMADGSRKKIDQIRVGDKIVATDPKTGKTRPQTVLAAFSGTRYERLVKIEVGGKEGIKDRSGIILATEHHLFWKSQAHQWTRAESLQRGDILRMANGVGAIVRSVDMQDIHPRVYDLTIAIDHTFYVLAGNTPVLVHNADSDLPDRIREAIENSTYTPRLNPDGTPDIFEIRKGTPGAIARKWGGSQIYDVPGGGNSYRIMVNKYGDIGWISGHNYGKINIYKPPTC
ncbi:polymorphic toxin-type HINT domain-containing protein [Actinomadura rupiterrae]|uniref:polymorphic toxin-type HINT domain-containing protein n=1 Tax=Actinomadura rupiterrae TaxID=559627 RepID=UPI0020A59323|nr:polymorphic toxin-type HINT domain-containing protein [Actinomadura rupiterrae]MCP2337282.1 RHS repeat-associated protein [Actinomadura rupiterrae]